MAIEYDIYPYEIDDQYHPASYLLFNAPDLPRTSVEVASNTMKWLEAQGVDLTPGKTHAPKWKYDALGGSGAPWENGIWIAIDEDRAPVVATAADKNITDMTPEERAELRAALEAAETAHRAGAVRHSDDTEEG